MALVSGFLKQSCVWTAQTEEFDAFGQPVNTEPQQIKCRWVRKSGWARGVMGDGTTASTYTDTVTVDSAVNAGDKLYLTGGDTDIGGVVKAVETIIDAGGKEQGRVCYV